MMDADDYIFLILFILCFIVGILWGLAIGL